MRNLLALIPRSSNWHFHHFQFASVSGCSRWNFCLCVFAWAWTWQSWLSTTRECYSEWVLSWEHAYFKAGYLLKPVLSVFWVCFKYWSLLRFVTGGWLPVDLRDYFSPVLPGRTLAAYSWLHQTTIHLLTLLHGQIGSAGWTQRGNEKSPSHYLAFVSCILLCFSRCRDPISLWRVCSWPPRAQTLFSLIIWIALL